MDNLELWNKVKQVPKEYLKPIQAGRLKGKSDINPMWRYQAMTDVFGPIGIGWKYEIKRVWTEPAPKDQVFCFAEINVYFDLSKLGLAEDRPTPCWSQPTPGIGGHMLVSEEGKEGEKRLHPNDEGYKMAITDALSVAMKMLGFGADVYAGLWDGSKYTNRATTTTDTTPKKETKPPTPVVSPTGEKEHWCSEHGIAFEKKTKDGKSWYSHKKEGGGYCNEKPEDPYKTVKEIAKSRGIENYDQLKEALGVEKLEQITPEAAMQIIESMPAF